MELTCSRNSPSLGMLGVTILHTVGVHTELRLATLPTFTMQVTKALLATSPFKDSKSSICDHKWKGKKK